MENTLLVFDYKSKEFLGEAWRAIREGRSWSVNMTGSYAKVLKQTRRWGKYFRDQERPKLTKWERFALVFQGLLIPSFWAMYFYATDKGMKASWSEQGNSILIQFQASDHSIS